MPDDKFAPIFFRLLNFLKDLFFPSGSEWTAAKMLGLQESHTKQSSLGGGVPSKIFVRRHKQRWHGGAGAGGGTQEEMR